MNILVLDLKPTPTWTTFSIACVVYWKQYICQMRSGDETSPMRYRKGICQLSHLCGEMKPTELEAEEEPNAEEEAEERSSSCCCKC